MGKERRGEIGETEPFHGSVSLLKTTDLPAIKAILDQLVLMPDSEEESVEEKRERYLQGMKESLTEPTDIRYLIAHEHGEAIGVVGIRLLHEKMRAYVVTEHPVELFNMYVSPIHQGRGVGKALVSQLFEEARKHAYTEVVWNSGIRFKDSWGFYAHLPGVESLEIAKDYWGTGGDAAVFRKAL